MPPCERTPAFYRKGVMFPGYIQTSDTKDQQSCVRSINMFWKESKRKPVLGIILICRQIKLFQINSGCLTRQQNNDLKLIRVILVRLLWMRLFIQCFLVGVGRSRGKQHRGLRTKGLMQDLGTKLECRRRVFVRNEKTLCKFSSGEKSIVAQPDSNCYPSVNRARLS